LQVPLTVGDTPIGVLAVDNQQSERTFNENDQYLLSALADQAAIAIENARLYQQIKGSEERYRDLFANAYDLIFTLDHQLLIRSINKIGPSLTGYPEAELRGRPLHDISAAETWEQAEQQFARHRKHQTGDVFKWRGRTLDKRRDQGRQAEHEHAADQRGNGHHEKKNIQLKSWVTETIEPKVVYKVDPTLQPEESKVVQKGARGYKAKAQRIVFVNGKEVEQEALPNSYYMPVEQIIAVQSDSQIPGHEPVEVSPDEPTGESAGEPVDPGSTPDNSAQTPSNPVSNPPDQTL
jgi:PAS domain S-box-containing protein